ncbi:MAG: MBL fold metallo-hydrolase [Candidatus Saccharimonadales bacterium]
MDFEFKGGNCVVISHKKDTFVIDPKLSDIGLKDQGGHASAHLLTQPRFAAAHDEETLIIDGPGEYEINNCSIKGIAAQAHLDTAEAPKAATIYTLDTADITVAILGHIYPTLNEEQLEAIGVVDILVVPVGGNGYTVDAKGAVELVRNINPKAVIPTHYAEEGVKYEVPQAPLEEFLKELGGTHTEPTAKLKLKSGQLPEILTVFQLQHTK